MEIDKGVDEVGNARTYVEKVNQLVVKIKVKYVRHVPLKYFLLPDKVLFEKALLYYRKGIYDESQRVDVLKRVCNVEASHANVVYCVYFKLQIHC